MELQLFTILGLVGWAFVFAYGEIFDWSKTQLYKFSVKKYDDRCFFDFCFKTSPFQIVLERTIVQALQFLAGWLFKLSCCPMCMGVWLGAIAWFFGYYHIVNPVIDIGIIGGLGYILDKAK